MLRRVICSNVLRSVWKRPPSAPIATTSSFIRRRVSPSAHLLRLNALSLRCFSRLNGNGHGVEHSPLRSAEEKSIEAGAPEREAPVEGSEDEFSDGDDFDSGHIEIIGPGKEWFEVASSLGAPQQVEKENEVIITEVGGKKWTREDMQIYENDIEERFVRGWGKGGQAVNKTSNAVVLKHFPTGTVVKCHQHRSLEANRKTARRIMKERIEELLLGKESRIQMRAEKVRRKKARKKRRNKKKYALKEKEKSEAQEKSGVHDSGEGSASSSVSCDISGKGTGSL